jgi:hypothetical protein
MSPDFVLNDRVRLEADEWQELPALTNNTDTPAEQLSRPVDVVAPKDRCG